MLKREALVVALISLLSFGVLVYKDAEVGLLQQSNNLLSAQLDTQSYILADMDAEIDVLQAVNESIEEELYETAYSDVMYAEDFVIERWENEVHFLGKDGWTDFSVKRDTFGNWTIDPWVASTFIWEDGTYMLTNDSFYDDVDYVYRRDIWGVFSPGMAPFDYIANWNLRDLLGY